MASMMSQVIFKIKRLKICQLKFQSNIAKSEISTAATSKPFPIQQNVTQTAHVSEKEITLRPEQHDIEKKVVKNEFQAINERLDALTSAVEQLTVNTKGKKKELVPLLAVGQTIF